MISSAILAIVFSQTARPVEFAYESKQALTSVCIVGEFNEWDRARFLLTPDESRTKWRGSFAIEPGGYNYLVCEDNRRWIPDPNRKQVTDANGNPLSRLVVLPLDFDKHAGNPGDGDVTISALLHRPDPQDIARLSTDRYYLRFRTRVGDVGAVSIRIANRDHPMAIARSDEIYDYWQGEFRANRGVLEYSFIARDGDAKISFPTKGGKFFQDISKLPLPNIPKWVEGAIFYQIFPDRFENGDRTNDPVDVQPWGTLPTATNRMGGDLKGIEARLPYLHELGINAIYLNPVFDSVSNHGYDTIDYLRIDPRLGELADLKRLVSTAHQLGIRVILDAVFNHSSPQFFAFADLVSKGDESSYRNWYFPLAFPIKVGEGQRTYRTFAGVPTMPKLNTENPETSNYLIRVGEYWIRECDIDGWRLDVADEVSPIFWRNFRTAIKKLKPDAYILGEVWGDAHTYLQGDQHDGVMNYRWRRLVQEWVMNPNSKVDGLVKGLRSIERDYPSAVQNSLLNVLSSHDTERLSTRLKGDESQIRIATALQFFLPGVPCVYYGDEIGLAGGHDPLCRGTMIWDRQNWNLERFNWYQELVRLRQNKPSLQFGKLVERTDSHGLLVLERTQKSDWSRLYVNRTLSSREIRLPKENATVLGYLAKQESGQLVIAAGGVALVGNRTRRPKLVDSDKS